MLISKILIGSDIVHIKEF